MNFDFGKTLTRAWQIIWKHKVLWIFGILASCARGSSGGSGSGGNSGYRTGPNDNPPFSTDQFDRVMSQVAHFIKQNPWIILAIVIGLFLLFILFYALGMMGRIGLIKGTYKAESGAERLPFGELWSESMPYFWRIFGLNFLLGLLVFVLIMLLFIPLIVVGVVTMGVGLLCLIPLLCIIIPASWALTLILEQAQAAIVLEDINMVDGFKRGWELVKSNVGTMIIMALILGFGGAIIGAIIAIPIILALIPLFIGVINMQKSLIPIWIALSCCVAYFPILIFLNGVLTAYIQSAWTLTFMQVSKPKESAPVLVAPNA